MSGTHPLAGTTVLHLGHFRPEYSRNRIVAKALRRAGARVETVTDLRPLVRRTPRLLHDAFRTRPDLIWVGFPGHGDMATARALATRFGVPVVFDAFISLAETAEDRQPVVPVSRIRMRLLELEDRVACKFANCVVLDTQTHANFFVERLGVPKHRVRRLWVGADDELLRRSRIPAGPTFRVFVYSSFAPLHGMEHVVSAARELEVRGVDAHFTVVGRGRTMPRVQRLARDLGVTNVEFRGKLDLLELPPLMRSAHVHLGIFEDAGKADRVIPNKVFDALAVGRPVITADTTAAREVLIDGTHALLCPPADPSSLADRLELLAFDESYRVRLADAGYELFRQRFCLDVAACAVATLVEDAIGAR